MFQEAVDSRNIEAYWLPSQEKEELKDSVIEL